MGAEITITRMGPPGDDDEEDDFIPPEILQMIQMTEAMHARQMASMFGGPMIKFTPESAKAKSNEPRTDETHDEIMARMNKLSEEIGERHEK